MPNRSRSGAESIPGRVVAATRVNGRSAYFYFRKRLTEARRDVQFALGFTLDNYVTREQQERALDILQFKLDVLWSMLDSMQVNLGIGRNK